MGTSYKHTQTGYVILISMGIGTLVCLEIILANGPLAVVIPLLLTLLVCSVLFGSLTIEISDGNLKWSFGPGLIRKKVSIAEIEQVEVVRNHWLHGWGIHLMPGGWLYNVSGMEAVEIRLKSGKRFRVGSDQPEELARALRPATKAVTRPPST